jgi:uncharacterized protein YndB with AHSA1/START domain
VIDRIERDTVIDAPITQVWKLVSRAGWWIGDGDRSGHVISQDGDLITVEDPRYGRYLMRIEAIDRPRYIAYRGGAEEGQPPTDTASTLVEFFLTETETGTRLRVVESGFAALDLTEEGRAAAIEDNTKGWEFQLGIARRDAGPR